MLLQDAEEIGAVDWSDLSTHKKLTCVNHQGMVYGTKNPWTRNLHILEIDESLAGTGKSECDCPFSDLRAIVTVLYEGA